MDRIIAQIRFDEDKLREIVAEAMKEFTQQMCAGCPYKEDNSECLCVTEEN